MHARPTGVARAMRQGINLEHGVVSLRIAIPQETHKLGDCSSGQNEVSACGDMCSQSMQSLNGMSGSGACHTTV